MLTSYLFDNDAFSNFCYEQGVDLMPCPAEGKSYWKNQSLSDNNDSPFVADCVISNVISSLSGIGSILCAIVIVITAVIGYKITVNAAKFEKVKKTDFQVAADAANLDPIDIIDVITIVRDLEPMSHDKRKEILRNIRFYILKKNRVIQGLEGELRDPEGNVMPII